MTVAEHDRVGTRQIDSKPHGVVSERHALAGVKEHAMGARVDPPGQPVPTEDARTAAVFSTRMAIVIINQHFEHMPSEAQLQTIRRFEAIKNTRSTEA